MADDLRPDLGVYGNKVVHTPNIDAFAASATVFDRSHVSMAICGPSRAALFTGLRPDTSGILNNDLRLDEAAPNVTTMVDQLKAAGYATASVGKVYHHVTDDKTSWDTIFRQSETNFSKSIEVVQDELALFDRIYADEALRRLDLLKNGSKPFFLSVGFVRPHLPFAVPQSDWDLYRETTFPTPLPSQSGAPYFAFLTSEPYLYADLSQFRRDQYLPVAWNSTVTSEQTRGYYASISFVDRQVGRLLARLNTLGLANNTIVVIWGDNGYKLGDYGYWTKASNAEIDTRVPLIIRAPGRTTAGTRVSALVEGVDIYPTLAQLAGIAPRDDIDGQSFVRLLDSPDTQWKSASFSQFRRNTADGDMKGSTVRTDRYRYTAWITAGQKTWAKELYDLTSDPSELRNVAGEPAYAAALADMEALRTGGGAPIRAELRTRLGI